MYHIQHSGYGYSKHICEDVIDWFITKYVPRHKIFLHVEHKGLKREQAYGFCDFVDECYRPRQFLIEIQSRLPKELYVKTLLHELVHLRQWVKGTLTFRSGKMHFENENVDSMLYHEQPHEIEAHNLEDKLYAKYMSDIQKGDY
tara:strand:+ start:363 stop:794 length:432 start_codon:yes stop_codon:yes gene_type:complete